MKLIKTEEAVGSVLCHDITQIIPGVVKDAVFRKGACGNARGYSGTALGWKKSICMYGRNKKECFMKTRRRKF